MPTSNFQPIRLLDPGYWYKFIYLWQIVQIQISWLLQKPTDLDSWLLQKPTDLDLYCLQRQGICGFSRLGSRVNINLPKTTINCCTFMYFNELWLLHCMLWANSADFWWFFFHCFQKILFDISCKLSLTETIFFMKYQLLFSGKNRKNISKCCLLISLPSMQSNKQERYLIKY